MMNEWWIDAQILACDSNKYNSCQMTFILVLSLLDHIEKWKGSTMSTGHSGRIYMRILIACLPATGRLAELITMQIPPL